MFTRETAQLVAQYASAPNSGHSEGRLLLEMTRVGAGSGLRSPAELPLLGKTLLNLEAVSSALDPELAVRQIIDKHLRSEEHTSELQSLMRSSYAVFCLKKK